MTLLTGMLMALGLYGQAADSTLLSKAHVHLEAKRCKDVDKVLAPLLKRVPPSSDAILMRSKCRIWYMDKDHAQQGLRDLQTALDHDPDHFDILYFRGDLYMDLRMFDRAEADLDRAVAVAPDTTALLRALDRSAWNHLLMRRFDKARADAQRAYDIDSLDRGALNNLAMIANESGDTAASYTILKAFIRAYPEDEIAWANMGFFLGSCGRHMEALEHYAEAERLGHGGASFLNNRGYSKLGVGDTKGARQDVERSIRMNSSNSYAYRNLALIELHEGHTAAACTALERALEHGYTNTFGNEVLDLRRANCR